ncbi:ATPase inhibitor IATP mitochondria [Penicillium brevicompactum]|uniref:ATPase inhibitor IATP mitochondria n=1 Tax=Penicillium brevicompactum TaxID=5074 RepID=A0A9W9QKA0_PENBR|nr:ATPase inhibitor IATP mitochondria [Penicillium brevicompactum]
MTSSTSMQIAVSPQIGKRHRQTCLTSHLYDCTTPQKWGFKSYFVPRDNQIHETIVISGAFPIMTLHALPNELLLNIAEFLDSQSSINAFARINHRCNNLLNSFLYNYNVQHHYGDALHWAAARGQLETARESLRQGANIEAIDPTTDRRPLFEASYQGHANIVALLVANGANVNATNGRGGMEQAITIAVSRNRECVLRVLLESGIDPNLATSKSGEHLLHIAAYRRVQSRLAVTKVLVEAGADLEALSPSSQTALQIACLHDPEVVRYLIESGANTDVRRPGGITVLHLAAIQGKINIVEVLWDLGFDINTKENCGHSVLYSACSNGRLEVAKFLLDRGAKINSRTLSGFTPLSAAVSWESNVFGGTGGEHGGITAFLLERGADPNKASHTSTTPLHLAVRSEHGLCKLLLQHGVDPESRTKTGITPLHEAARSGSLESARTLLAANVNVQSKDKDKNTPLHFAARRYHPELVELLLQAGADPMAKNRHGKLAADVAMEGIIGRSNEKRAKLRTVLDHLEASSSLQHK